MNFKRKQKRSQKAKKCGVCCGQRREHGEERKMKLKLKILDKEFLAF